MCVCRLCSLLYTHLVEWLSEAFEIRGTIVSLFFLENCAELCYLETIYDGQLLNL